MTGVRMSKSARNAAQWGRGGRRAYKKLKLLKVKVVRFREAESANDGD